MPEPHRDLVVIRSFSNAIAARIAQAALDVHDIPSLVIGDDAGGVYPALTFAHGVRLAVAHEDAVRALHVLDAPVDPALD